MGPRRPRGGPRDRGDGARGASRGAGVLRGQVAGRPQIPGRPRPLRVRSWPARRRIPGRPAPSHPRLSASVWMPRARTISPMVANFRRAGSARWRRPRRRARPRAGGTPAARPGARGACVAGASGRCRTAGPPRRGHPPRHAWLLVRRPFLVQVLRVERLGLSPLLGAGRLAGSEDGFVLTLHLLVKLGPVLGASAFHVAPFVACL